MILVDASIWITHIKKSSPELSRLLSLGAAWCHDFTIGEVALGSMKNRLEIVSQLRALEACTVASSEETLIFIDQHQLNGRGIGYIDCHLLASCRLDQLRLWTADKKLAQIAVELEVAYVG